MNKVMLIGRLVRDPDVKTSQSGVVVARYTLAVDRRFKKDGEQSADFIGCIAFGKTAEFAEKYFTKGIKIAVVGRIQTGSYENKDGQRVYTTDVVVEENEFTESKRVASESASQSGGTSAAATTPADATGPDGFMNIPDDIDEELPFD